MASRGKTHRPKKATLERNSKEAIEVESQVLERIKESSTPVDAIEKILSGMGEIFDIDSVPWEDPKAYRTFNRKRQWYEMYAFAAVRGFYIKRLRQYLDRVDEDMANGGFDPAKKEHFGLIQSLITAIPSKPKDASKMFEQFAKYFGHLSDKGAGGTSLILADDIQEAVIALKRRVPRSTVDSGHIDPYHTSLYDDNAEAGTE
jgi:hypothetical protein